MSVTTVSDYILSITNMSFSESEKKLDSWEDLNKTEFTSKVKIFSLISNNLKMTIPL